MFEAAAEKAATDVFLVSDNRLIREALARVLNRKPDIRVVAVTSFSSTLVNEITGRSVDVVLLDCPRLGLTDLQLIGGARLRMPRVRVVLIGMDADTETFLRAIRAGAVGYILKDASAQEFTAAIRAVANDEAVCPPNLCLALFENFSRNGPRAPILHSRARVGLTRREQQLVQLVGCGLSNKEIANNLSLSEHTVKNHIHRMLRKLGATDRLSAVELCRVNGVTV